MSVASHHKLSPPAQYLLCSTPAERKTTLVELSNATSRQVLLSCLMQTSSTVIQSHATLIDMNDQLSDAEQTMVIAAAKALGPVESFVPYLRAAIAYWRLKEHAAQDNEDMVGHVEAVTQRLTFEEKFREATGHNYNAAMDAISLAEVSAWMG
jgi:hypothetical protein